MSLRPSAIGELLAANPLPPIGGDKRDRGTLLLVAGGEGCPGAAVLAAVAALRIGAGRVQVVCHPTVTTAVGIAVPEALVVGWDGAGPLPEAVAGRVGSAAAVCVGPGLEAGADHAARAVAEHLPPGTPLLLDAQALPAAADLRRQHLLVLPNLGEATDLAADLGLDPPSGDDAADLARALALELGSVAAVRGEETVVAGSEGTWTSTGDPGLGTAGSGDVLVGLAAGLAARGLPELVTVGWAVAVHAAAGRHLGGGRPNPGYLARELPDAVPEAVTSLGDGFRRQDAG